MRTHNMRTQKMKTHQMKTHSIKASKLILFLLAFALIFTNSASIPPAYATEATGTLSFAQTSSPASGYEGGTATLKIQITNSTTSNITGKFEIGTTSLFASTSPAGFTAVYNTTPPAATVTPVTFPVDLTGVAPGSYTVPIVATWDGGASSQEFTCRVQVKALADVIVIVPPSEDIASVSISQDLENSDGIVAGEANDLIIIVTNNGDVTLANTEVNIILPAGLSLDNSGSTKTLDTLSVGSHKHAVFPILADNNIKSGSYAITVNVNASYGTKGKTSIATETIYVPVKASGSTIQTNLDITSIKIPAEVSAGQDFVLSFSVANIGTKDLSNLKITVDGGSDVINKSKNIFIEPILKKGGIKTYAITYYVPASAAEKFYPIKISVESSTSTEAASDVITQYTGVLAKSAAGSKKPQLIIDNYGYGGSSVQAGSTIKLNLTLLNTSASQNISNIKVTLSAEDGAFIPYNSSNSFYVESIGKKQRFSRSINLSVKPDAVQKTTAITVGMFYEDSSGNPYESNDVISIPVMQQTKLVVDDIIAPPDIFPGQPMSVSVQFYNMGKTVLSNLKITAEGNFTPTETTNTYVGNMEKGSSDYYDFSFIPNEAGPMTGNVIFTYEDLSGNQQVMRKAFEFQVINMPEQPIDPGLPPPDTGGGSKLPFIIAGILLALALAGFLIWRKRRKNKKAKELEFLDE